MQPLWRTVWQFIKKLKIKLSYDPEIPLLSIMCRDKQGPKGYMHANVHSALFTIAKTWNPPKCPSAEQWIKKMWYISTMDYYAAIIKNEVMPFAATWMGLEIVILSEVSQKEEEIFYNVPYMWNLKSNDTNELLYTTETDYRT